MSFNQNKPAFVAEAKSDMQSLKSSFQACTFSWQVTLRTQPKLTRDRVSIPNGVITHNCLCFSQWASVFNAVNYRSKNHWCGTNWARKSEVICGVGLRVLMQRSPKFCLYLKKNCLKISNLPLLLLSFNFFLSPLVSLAEIPIVFRFKTFSADCALCWVEKKKLLCLSPRWKQIICSLAGLQQLASLKHFVAFFLFLIVFLKCTLFRSSFWI